MGHQHGHSTTRPSWRVLVLGSRLLLKIAVALAVAAIPRVFPPSSPPVLPSELEEWPQERHCPTGPCPSVETLGCTSVICSDKTGTLQHDVHLQTLHLFKDESSLGSSRSLAPPYEPIGDLFPGGRKVKGSDSTGLEEISTIAMCNDTAIDYNSQEHFRRKVGEATETVLITLIEKLNPYGMSKSGGTPRVREGRAQGHRGQVEEGLHPRVLSRDRKSMSSYCSPKKPTRLGNGPKMKVCKGWYLRESSTVASPQSWNREEDHDPGSARRSWTAQLSTALAATLFDALPSPPWITHPTLRT